ncbi:MAG TPA: long-chain fatty acid--CoA ligase [Gemmatimonadales bacterium]|nr:long-chain fatty acid--CoA ligase [Gemmatimonadales bacterium]
MLGLTMDYQLTLAAVARRAESLFGDRPVVSRRADRSIHRSTWSAVLDRAYRLAGALRALGVAPGDRVATLCWNHDRHLEAYFAVPLLGAVLHTLNLRLQADELAYIARHAEDRVLIVDQALLPVLERFRERAGFRHVIVIGDGDPPPAGMLDYESLIAAAPEERPALPELDERSAAVMCYTSGTTGRSKGVVYSHRALVLHSMATAMAGSFAISSADTILAVIPMFHANAWGLPFTAALTGAAIVFPGMHLEAESLLELCERERVTFSAGVPTVWLGVLERLDACPGVYDLSALRTIVIGGAGAPESLVRGLEERHGIRVLTSWGMTEIAPVGTLGTLTPEAEALPAVERHALRMKAGVPGALLELRVRNEQGEVPRDGVTMGELEVRGAYVASGYWRPEEDGGWFTDDGWFRTGDIATIDPRGYLEIRDRTKDLIKSGGEWISSVALEGALMGHPAVAEAAVVAVPHRKWGERPLAAVVLRVDRSVTAGELRECLSGRFPVWWLPDDVVFLPAIPRTSTGKFLKSALRDQYRDHYGGP